MNGKPERMQLWANCLVEYEGQGKESMDERALAGFQVFEMLKPKLARLMGNSGVRWMLSRALFQANEKTQWLRAVKVNPGGSLEGLEGSEKLRARLAPEEILEGAQVLFAHYLFLIVEFIGETLTLRFVLVAWPEISLTELESGHGGKNEKKSKD